MVETTEKTTESRTGSIKVEFNLTELTREVYNNYPEYGCYGLKCMSFNYDRFIFRFHDVEEDKYHIVTLRKAEEGVQKLLDAVAEKKLFFDGMSAMDMLDAGAWDAYCTDAALQMAIFGKVIYG